MIALMKDITEENLKIEYVLKKEEINSGVSDEKKGCCLKKTVFI